MFAELMLAWKLMMSNPSVHVSTQSSFPGVWVNVKPAPGTELGCAVYMHHRRVPVAAVFVKPLFHAHVGLTDGQVCVWSYDSPALLVAHLPGITK